MKLSMIEVFQLQAEGKINHGAKLLIKNCSLESCLEIAFNTIKRQKGRVMNGVFVKDQDLQKW